MYFHFFSSLSILHGFKRNISQKEKKAFSVSLFEFQLVSVIDKQKNNTGDFDTSWVPNFHSSEFLEAS